MNKIISYVKNLDASEKTFGSYVIFVVTFTVILVVLINIFGSEVSKVEDTPIIYITEQDAKLIALEEVEFLRVELNNQIQLLEERLDAIEGDVPENTIVIGETTTSLSDGQAFLIILFVLVLIIAFIMGLLWFLDNY